VEDVVALLVRGTANRRVGETQMNDRSSRSHCVFTAAVERRVPGGAPGAAPTLLRSRLHLVDLAGSERQKTSGAAGERLREASSINKSLSALGLVIMNLVKAQRAPATHVPYRDSKLTHLLQDSLGGNARTVMVAAVSPVAVNAAETLSTLRFADSAKRIKNRAVVNEEAEGDAEALRKEVARLKSELAAARQGSGVIHGGGGTPVKSLVPALGAADGPPPSTRMTQAGGPAGEGTRRALMGALRREEAAAAAAAATAEELQQLRGLVAAKDSDLQRSHMMLKLKDGRLARLAAGGEGSDERAAALQAEVDVLRARVDNHPDLKRFALENLRLAQEAARLGGAAAAGELDALLGDVVALRRELLGLAAAAEEAQDGAAAARADADAAQERWRRGEARLAEVQAQLRCREEAGPEARARAEALAAENEELRLQLVAAAGLRQELDQMTAHAAG
jgi:kinesin family protein 15